jgi:hypothetical protein
MDSITLATLPQATPQQVFDQVVEHLLRQGKKSKTHIGSTCFCSYRGEGNTKCAAGCLIADHEYTVDFEGERWQGLLHRGFVTEEHKYLIYSLQLVHDYYPVHEWPDKLRDIADEYGLEYTPDTVKPTVVSSNIIFYRSGYYPGTPITMALIESLVTRLLAELRGLDFNGYTHVGLRYCLDNGKSYVAELCDEGVIESLATEEFADYYESYLVIPLKAAAIYEHEKESADYGAARVTTISLLQKFFGLSVTGWLCTDLVEHQLLGTMNHLSTEELFLECLCTGVIDTYQLYGRENKHKWGHFAITPDVKNVAHVTTWQFILMGMATALGVGHIIRTTHSDW